MNLYKASEILNSVFEDLGEEGMRQQQVYLQGITDTHEWWKAFFEFHASYTDQGEFGFGGDWWKAVGESDNESFFQTRR